MFNAMAQFYKLVQNKNEEMPKAYQKWYARPVYVDTLDLDGVAELIQRNSTAKKSDARAVLTEMVEVIADALKDSKRVHIDGFGTFKVGISSRGADSPEDYSVNEHIRGARILFQPETITDPSTHKKSKKLIQGMKFKSSVGLVNPEEIPDSEKEKAMELHKALVEAAAENDEGLMEKFFETETLTEDELREGFEGLIAKLDATNEKRKAASALKAAEKQAEKAPIREALFAVISDEAKTATELIEAAGLDIKPASVPSLLKPFVESGEVAKVDVKVKGKGTQRGYVLG